MVLFGILRAGMTVVNISAVLAREPEAQLRDSGIKAIIVLENFAGTLQKVLPTTAIEHVVTSQIGDHDGYRQLARQFRGQARQKNGAALENQGGCPAAQGARAKAATRRLRRSS